MSGPKRNPDKLNTIGVVVVGICGAVLVYVSIVALQAFYMNDTSEVQTMADYGGQDTAHQSLRATQANVIEDCGPNARPEAGKQQTYRIPIKYAIKLVADGAKVDPANLVPTQGRSDKGTILPIFGRPKITPAQPDATAPAAPASTDVPMPSTGGQGPGGGQPPGQGPTPGTGAGGPPSGTGAADPNPTGAQTPSSGGAASGGTGGDPKRPGAGAVENKDLNKAGSASPGGNPPTPAPKAGASDPKAGTAPPKAGTPPAPKAGSAAAPKAAPKAGSAAKGSAK